jgi:hypothetical protein
VVIPSVQSRSEPEPLANAVVNRGFKDISPKGRMTEGVELTTRFHPVPSCTTSRTSAGSGAQFSNLSCNGSSLQENNVSQQVLGRIVLGKVCIYRPRTWRELVLLSVT